jgi:DNA-binding Lrp family transcriptional regulator
MMCKSSLQSWSFCIVEVGLRRQNCTVCGAGDGTGGSTAHAPVHLLAPAPAPGRTDVIDELDARLIELLTAEPRVGVLEASRRLGVARGTVQARLDRLQARGVVTGYGPDIDPAALGHGVSAFVTLEIRQAGGHDPVVDRLADIPEVLEVHTITGNGDMLCRVVARTNADLQRVIDAIVAVAGVVRASTVIALATPVPYRVLPLVRAMAGINVRR